MMEPTKEPSRETDPYLHELRDSYATRIEDPWVEAKINRNLPRCPSAPNPQYTPPKKPIEKPENLDPPGPVPSLQSLGRWLFEPSKWWR